MARGMRLLIKSHIYSMRPIIVIFIVLLLAVGAAFFIQKKPSSLQMPNKKVQLPTTKYPLDIALMRTIQYPGSDITIEETLASGSNYSRYRASYISEGLKQYGLLTVPMGEMPKNGFPAIVFIHGYVPPEEYRTEERYIAYVDSLARAGYVVFKIDLRGHDQSEGQPTGAYFSPGYTVDALNAYASLERYDRVNKDRIGLWGHSMGGNITQRFIVTSQKPKAAVVWGAVISSYEDMYREWWGRRRTPTWQPSEREQITRRSSRQQLTDRYGSPSARISFWASIDPFYFYKDIQTPLQIHHGTADETVPWQLSQLAADELKKQKKPHELYLYDGADHNISDPSFSLAMQRTIAYFDKYLKE